MSDRTIDPHEAIDFLYHRGKDFAAAKADRIFLTEFRKSKKALLMKASGMSTSAAQETDAYSHPDYLELLQGLKVAVEKEARMEWELKAAEARIEVWRSQEASNRRMDRATQ